VWPKDLGEIHKDRLLIALESEAGIVSRVDAASSRHIFLKSKQGNIEWPFPLNRDGSHFAPLIVCRILERFEIPHEQFIERLRGMSAR
jgi:hypothetical protein